MRTENENEDNEDKKTARMKFQKTKIINRSI